jgi:hypothetical protein
MVLEYLYTNICPCPKSPSYVGFYIPALFCSHMGNRKMMKHGAYVVQGIVVPEEKFFS